MATTLEVGTDVRLIRNQEDHLWGKQRLRELLTIHKERGLNPKERDAYELLLMAVQKYEADNFMRSDHLTPQEAIKERMEDLGLRRADLAPWFGARSRVTEFFAGRRRLTVEAIYKLHKHLGLPYEVLIPAVE